MATLMTLVSFDGTDDGAYPQGSLIIDSSWDDVPRRSGW
jgi:hypothetical protein